MGLVFCENKLPMLREPRLTSSHIRHYFSQDFFYLPIDFKNKCNRGYAFVNFVDYKDIIPFYDAYNGTSWSRFNSDKICDITYARIQGKAAMLKRFENSALMEKDDEYRPLVFVRKGQLEAMHGTNMR
jgi:RNA recognition motif-containing protein